MNTKAEEIISILKLKSHPEGGYFKETYRSQTEIPNSCLPETYTGRRNFSTSIYFLLTSEMFSAFHRIKQDEIWHFYDGSPLKLHIISNSGKYSCHHIGNDIFNNEIPQLTVFGGNWFAAEVIQKNSYSLIGCTVSPGFDFDDFELKAKKELVELFPEHKSIISRLTHH